MGVLETERLGDPANFRFASGSKRQDRRDHKALFALQQPVHGFLVGESAVRQYRERSAKFRQHFGVTDEKVWNLPYPVDSDCQERAVFDESADPADTNAENLDKVRNRQPTNFRIFYHVSSLSEQLPTFRATPGKTVKLTPVTLATIIDTRIDLCQFCPEEFRA